MRANLVCLHVKLSDANEFLPVTCAVCNNLNAPMLLGTDVVDRLCAQSLSEEINDMSNDCRPTDDLNENVNVQINVNEVTFNNGDDGESVINVDDAVMVNDMCDEFNESDHHLILLIRMNIILLLLP